MEFLEQAIQRFKSLDPRERYMVMGGAVAVLLILIYALIWEPVVMNKIKLEKRSQQLSRDLVWMQQQAEEAKRLKASSAPVGRLQAGQSLLGVIDLSAKGHQLGGSVKRVKPDGEAKAHVWLENAKFNDVIRWVENLKRRYNVEVGSATLEKQDQAGLISGRFVFITGTQ